MRKQFKSISNRVQIDFEAHAARIDDGCGEKVHIATVFTGFYCSLTVAQQIQTTQTI